MGVRCQLAKNAGENDKALPCTEIIGERQFQVVSAFCSISNNQSLSKTIYLGVFFGGTDYIQLQELPKGIRI
jgi:hypothetical protein